MKSPEEETWRRSDCESQYCRTPLWHFEKVGAQPMTTGAEKSSGRPKPHADTKRVIALLPLSPFIFLAIRSTLRHSSTWLSPSHDDSHRQVTAKLTTTVNSLPSSERFAKDQSCVSTFVDFATNQKIQCYVHLETTARLYISDSQEWSLFCLRYREEDNVYEPIITQKITFDLSPLPSPC